jgi:pyruvate dehydrogenase E2 component (dihydrolipoamide acetyltransferase)
MRRQHRRQEPGPVAIRARRVVIEDGRAADEAFGDDPDAAVKPGEYEGGTTAVSNLGMFGIHEFSAVINPPQATILAVGAGEQRPIVKDGRIEIATMMTVTLSCDHRAVDGALGAQFLGAFKTFIENPVGMVM